MAVNLVSDGRSSRELYTVVRRILDGNMLCAMASSGEAGGVHINNAFFGFDDGLTIYFLSHPASEHARNIQRAGDLAVAVCDSAQPWGQQHAGLQLFGRAEPAAAAVAETARRCYGARFPLFTDFVEKRLAEGAAKPSFFDLKFYVFRPARIRVMAEADFGDEVLVDVQVSPGGGR